MFVYYAVVRNDVELYILSQGYVHYVLSKKEVTK